MAELHDPVETGMPRSVRFGIAAVVVLIVFAWFLPRKVGDNNGDSTEEGAKSETTVQSTSDRETERQLSGILAGLSPELVVISSDRMARVAELGQWAGESLNKGDAAAVTIDRAANEKYFSGEALTEVNDATFSARDAHHITLANLAGEVATQVSQKTSDPIERIDELFRYVILQTTLTADEQDSQLPGTPFESLLIGRATAAGRAWAFGTLLRQLRIDAVILEPKTKPEAWLVGVIAPSGDVLLYDMRRGTGLPVAEGPAGFKKTASLKQVREKPELLRILDIRKDDQSVDPYPLKTEDLAGFNVKLITDSSASSERMAKLQTMISGALMEVFDGVGKSPLREQGLAERVIAAGQGAGWTAADVAVWDYPEQQASAFMSNGAEESKAWRGIHKVFLGPVILTQVRKQTRGEQDPTSEAVVQRTDQPLRKVRVDHLKGRLKEALPNYGRIRDAARFPSITANPEFLEELAAARPLNQKAAELAVFWIALCQMEQNPKLVRNTLDSYLRLYPEGEKIEAVPDLLAMAMAESGDRAGAIRFLKSGQRTPYRDVLIKQWTEPAATNPPASSEKPPENGPTEPKAAPAPNEASPPAPT